MSSAWLVTTGSYSDYEVLAVALTEAEARQYADAYNGERDSLYRNGAEVEEVDLYREGDRLPVRMTFWNAQGDRAWQYTTVVTNPAEYRPHVKDRRDGRGPFAWYYPTAEAALAAVAQASQLASSP